MDKADLLKLLYNNHSYITEQYETNFDNAVIILQNERLLKELKELARLQRNAHAKS